MSQDYTFSARYHELWFYSQNFTETKRATLKPLYENDEEGLYISYDKDGDLIRCGVIENGVCAKVKALTPFDNEVRWEIKVPFPMYKDRMNHYKQQLKRYHQGKKFY